MPKKHNKSSEPLAAGGELVWPKPITNLRPLTDLEMQDLERALGKPVDREHLVHWISRSIGDVVRLSTRPTAKERRNELMQLAREGRRWLEHINGSFGASFLRQSAHLDELTTSVAQFCDSIDSLGEHLRATMKAGRPRAAFALDAFLDRMIGIAKLAKVLPSTPTRALRTKRAPPAFFNFVVEALAISRGVIKSSPLTDSQKAAALSILRIQSKEALGKILERLRGRIADYRNSPHGLIEWNSD